jgi:hypothetical protein
MAERRLGTTTHPRVWGGRALRARSRETCRPPIAERRQRPVEKDWLPALGAAVTAGPTSAPAPATPTAISTALAGPGDVDVERASVENRAVHGVGRSLSLVISAVFHEAEASRLAAVTIDDDAGGHDVSVRREGVTELLVADGIGKIAYVEFVHDNCLTLRLKTLGRTLGAIAFSDVPPNSGSHSSRFRLARRNRRYL